VSARVVEYWRAVPTAGSSWRQRHGQLRLALRDLQSGLQDWRVWTFLAQHEIRQRYRRSLLGPLWLTLGLAVNVCAIGVIWSRLFKLEPSQLVPNLTLGIMVWNLLVGMINEGCHSFTAATGYITQTNRPLSTYALVVVWRNYLIAAHNFIVYVGVAIVFELVPNLNTLAVIPGLLALVLATSWPPLLLGILTARFRDIALIVQSVMTVAMFLTPVLWHKEQLGDRAYLATLNPLSHVIDVVRMPLLGAMPPLESWLVVLGSACVGWSLALILFARARPRISYWL
jgi:ABC-type polysaccharide/polyol phosphate export permease